VAEIQEPLHRVEVSAGFIGHLESIERFLLNADAAFAYDALLADLRSIVIPNLARFPLFGKRYLAAAPQSVEALDLLRDLPAGAGEALRVVLHDAWLILYAPDAPKRVVHLLAIRHHRQLSFDFERIWPRQGDRSP